MSATKEQVKWAHKALGCDLFESHLWSVGDMWQCETHASSLEDSDDSDEAYQVEKRCAVAWHLAQQLAEREATS